jgi:predicted ester cyclase
LWIILNRETAHMSYQKEAVKKLIDEVWSQGNLEIVDQLIAPHYTIKHDPGDPWEGKTLDIKTFKERVQMSRHVFPDQKFYIEDLVGEGDKVAVSWRFTGTHQGDIPGLTATNKAVNVSGLTIYYFSNRKMIGHWQVVDRLGLMQ